MNWIVFHVKGVNSIETPTETNRQRKKSFKMKRLKSCADKNSSNEIETRSCFVISLSSLTPSCQRLSAMLFWVNRRVLKMKFKMWTRPAHIAFPRIPQSSPPHWLDTKISLMAPLTSSETVSHPCIVKAT